MSGLIDGMASQLGVARRGPTEREKAVFMKDGVLNVYAIHAHEQLLALAYYLHHWRNLGHEEAARRACERFGHEPHGARCRRCGAPVTKQRR